MAVALPAFSPRSMRAAGKAIKAGKDVLVELDPEQALDDQLRALPGVTGVLVTGPLTEAVEAALSSALESRDLFLLDARPDALGDAEEPRDDRVLRLPRAAHLGTDEAAVVGRNLAIRWGHGVVTADAAPAGARRAEAFIEAAREDGYIVRLPAEVAREHGRGVSAGR